MTAIPAKLAGVKKIVMINPWQKGKIQGHVLAAAKIAGVDEIYKLGGVQGVAALATGTASVPKVDKIVGPGSIWVTAAKIIAQSRGLCGIDSIAGPSEILVIADSSANPKWAATDLLSQAEHGLDSSSVLVSTSKKLLNDIEKQINTMSKEFSKANPDIKKAAKNITAVHVKSMNQAIEVSNLLAPEHLAIMSSSPRKVLKDIRHAGSIFLGNFSPVPAGDYMAGANHVLPTGGSARFCSPLGVHDFVKRQSVTSLSKKAMLDISDECGRFAEIEGLLTHAKSARCRREK